MIVDFIPDKGVIIWLSFDPQAGREQAGRRPAVVLSPAMYNEKSGLALVCPITNKIKSYPFEVRLPDDLPVSGVVLSDHLKSIDWNKRRAEFICQAPDEVMSEVQSKLAPLIGF